MSGRQTIVEALETALEKCKVIGDVRELGELDSKYEWAVQLFRVSVKPAGRLGQFLEEYETWVVDPRLTTDEVLENSLDEHLDALLLALLPLSWLTFDEAKRKTHPSKYHGYQLTLTAVTQEQENEE